MEYYGGPAVFLASGYVRHVLAPSWKWEASPRTAWTLCELSCLQCWGWAAFENDKEKIVHVYLRYAGTGFEGIADWVSILCSAQHLFVHNNFTIKDLPGCLTSLVHIQISEEFGSSSVCSGVPLNILLMLGESSSWFQLVINRCFYHALW